MCAQYVNNMRDQIWQILQREENVQDDAEKHEQCSPAVWGECARCGAADSSHYQAWLEVSNSLLCFCS